MNLHSPTTLLSNVQFMRNRLRSDKELLMDIKNDFSHMTKKPKPPPIQTILEESLRDSTPHPNLSLSKQQKAGDKTQRAKVLELKKQHQRQVSKLKQQHLKQMKQLMEAHQKEKEHLEQCWKQKVQEQLKYIAILEEQVSSPIQSEREKISYEQYDAVINQLLQENTRLHNQLQQARDQCEQWRKQNRQLSAEVNHKSRFHFVNKKNTSKTADTEVDSAFISQVIAKSNYFSNDQNRNTSNFSSQWEDCQIQNDEGGLRTIRQFGFGKGALNKRRALLGQIDGNL